MRMSGPPGASENAGPDQPRPTEVTVWELDERHVAPVVELHVHAFPDFFLTFLGRAFLRQLYLSYCHDPATIALVAMRENGGEILGAVIGPLQPGRFYKRLLLKRWWRFGLAACGAVLRKPAIVPRLLRAVRYRGDEPTGGGERALLASIAVSPAAQGLGVGKLLTQEFLARVQAAGLPGALLTTDAEQNDAVNAFYQRQGWKLEGFFTTPENRRMNRYVYDF
jgi:ribosomal protein S18 acetylase RimI-like enzyme